MILITIKKGVGMIEYQIRLAKFIERGIRKAGGSPESVPVLLLALVGWSGWPKVWAVLQEAPLRRKCLEDVIAEELGIPPDLAWTVMRLNYHGGSPSRIVQMLRSGHLSRWRHPLFRFFSSRLIQTFRIFHFQGRRISS